MEERRIFRSNLDHLKCDMRVRVAIRSDLGLIGGKKILLTSFRKRFPNPHWSICWVLIDEHDGLVLRTAIRCYEDLRIPQALWAIQSKRGDERLSNLERRLQ